MFLPGSYQKAVKYIDACLSGHFSIGNLSILLPPFKELTVIMAAPAGMRPLLDFRKINIET